ncbi:hypothetical protein CHARACLAT_029698 [Characodon lateralis]|uniref:Uncharacterized protein n=1 Tax=Characodon lateralis TaxID=208331 RepID=A0ABU7EQ49_9TELE|nr:hypothetical protein [Characodon lateralis]
MDPETNPCSKMDIFKLILELRLSTKASQMSCGEKFMVRRAKLRNDISMSKSKNIVSTVKHGGRGIMLRVCLVASDTTVNTVNGSVGQELPPNSSASNGQVEG